MSPRTEEDERWIKARHRLSQLDHQPHYSQLTVERTPLDTTYSPYTPEMPKWTIEEEIVLVYYVSRQIKHATIVDILVKKCRPEVRTVKQIIHKAARLRTAYGQKENAKEDKWPARNRVWDRKLSDRWILSRMEKAELEKLLKFDGETAAIIDDKNDLNKFVDIMLLNDGETADPPDQPTSPTSPTSPTTQASSTTQTSPTKTTCGICRTCRTSVDTS